MTLPSVLLGLSKQWATPVVLLGLLASPVDRAHGQGPPAEGAKVRGEISGLGNVEGRVEWATPDSLGFRQNLRGRPDPSRRVSIGDIRTLEISEVTGNHAVPVTVFVGLAGLLAGRLADHLGDCQLYSGDANCSSSAGRWTVVGSLAGIGIGAIAGINLPAYGPWIEVRPAAWARSGQTPPALGFTLSFR